MKKTTDCKELALKKVNISGDVIGKFGTFEIEQTFVNNTKKVLEVGYTFPIVETATVVGFEVIVGDKVMKGQCKEKAEAKKEYQKNIVKGNSAYLLEEESDNIFAITIGKLAKNEEVTIKIKFIDKFEIVDNQIQLLIPTLVPPKYNCKITEKLSYGKVKYTVDFNINVSKNLGISEITSDTHKLNISEDETNHKVEVLNYDMSKDFKLNIGLKEELSSNALIAKNREGEDILYLSFMPEILDSYEDSEKDYIFLIDVSGSMYGEKLEETKHAVIECLKQLDEGDKFNIIAFESEFKSMCRMPIKFNESNLKNAIKYVKGLKATGGTEIFEPIQFSLEDGEDTEKIILLFTDGEVGNEEEIIDYVQDNIGQSRIFPFGIDMNVNTFFIKELANVGQGKAELIMPSERIDDKIIRTFARIQTPLLEDLTIDYGKNKVIDEIRESNTLFNYEFFNAFVKIEGLVDNITLKGHILGNEYSWEIKKEDVVKTDVNLEVLFAKEEIDRLEDYIRSSEDDDAIENYKSMIVELSEKYNVNSKYTSFLTVYDRDNKIIGKPKYEETVLSSENTIIGCIDDFFACEASPKRSLSACDFFSGAFNSVKSSFSHDDNCLYSLEIPDFLRSSSDSRLADRTIDNGNMDFVDEIDDPIVADGLEFSTRIGRLKHELSLHNTPKDRLEEKVEEYYNQTEEILTKILYAIYYLASENNEFDLSEFITFLKDNLEEVQSSDENMQLLCICYDITKSTEIYDMLTDEYKYMIDKNIKPDVDLNLLTDSEASSILYEDSVQENLDEVLWYLYNQTLVTSKLEKYGLSKK